tara:strand:- start:3472 stop:4578 length:1107 start_codon:yes stop_codon:yes gene_type:complete
MKIFYSILKLIFSKKFDFIFFSEEKSYQKYYILLIEKLLTKKYSIAYLSSDKNDFINLKGINNFYVGEGLTRMFAFMIVRSKFLFLTLPDLGYNEIKKQPDNINYYIYFFHAVNSAHRAFKKNAFNNYDIIFCAGEYHYNELRKLEEINNSKKKFLPKTGYLYFDYLSKNNKELKKEDFVLVAPSWNYNKKNFLNETCLNLITNLLKSDQKVFFRPHMEHHKRNKNTLNTIKEKFSTNKNFIFDEKTENLDSMLKSKILITDNSGIAIEYMFSLKRPVIYFDYFSKIHNELFDKINIKPMEDQIKEKFGYFVKEKHVDDLDLKHLISDAEKKFLDNSQNLQNFINKNFFNFENSLEKYIEFLQKKFNN